MKPILIIAGLPGSGKTSVANFLHENFGLRVVNAGDCLARHLSLEATDLYSRADIGPLFLERYTANRIFEFLHAETRRVNADVVDGVRLQTTCKQFRESNPSNRIWMVTCSITNRLDRLEEKLSSCVTDPAAIKNAFEKYSIYDLEEMSIRTLADELIQNDEDLETLFDNARHAYETFLASSSYGHK
jgi:dephospho-CoA kinase